jgi:hypothetical protein
MPKGLVELLFLDQMSLSADSWGACPCIGYE